MLKALRIPSASFTNKDEFKRYYQMVKDNLDIVDEVTMFVDATHHGYTPYEVTLETAEAVKGAIKAYKELGVKKVGINVLATLGHTEDGSGLHEKADMQYMVNFENQESGSCLCPSDEKFIKYIQKKYATFAETGTDYIWMDDDVRVDNHGIVTGFCYCPKCIEKYNERYGKNYTFADIKEKWDKDETLRQTWKDSAYLTMSNMVAAIHDAIKSVNPQIEIGFMSGTKNCVSEWIEASHAKKGRPGGGYYNDTNPLELFEKSFAIQMQVVSYPKNVSDIQYEYESYNGRTLEKSFHTTEMETSLCIMSGCNGILYNRHTMVDEPKFFEMMRKSTKKWDFLANINEGCDNLGVFCADKYTAQRMSEVSIPVTSNLKKAVAAVVLGEQWNNYSNAEIEEILDKNVLTDGRGAQVLIERGFKADVCATIDKTYHSGVVEYFQDHELNGKMAGKIRAVSMDIHYEGDAYQLIPDDYAEVVTTFKSGGKMFGCAMCSAVMPSGRKFIADGMLMPGQAQTETKRTQLMHVFRWLSNNTMPVVIEKSIKVVPLVRGKNNEPQNILLCNAHFDPTEEFEVEVRSDKEFYIISQSGEYISVPQRHVNGKTYITIENIPGWDYILLTSVRG